MVLEWRRRCSRFSVQEKIDIHNTKYLQISIFKPRIWRNSMTRRPTTITMILTERVERSNRVKGISPSGNTIRLQCANLMTSSGERRKHQNLHMKTNSVFIIKANTDTNRMCSTLSLSLQCTHFISFINNKVVSKKWIWNKPIIKKYKNLTWARIPYCKNEKSYGGFPRQIMQLIEIRSPSFRLQHEKEKQPHKSTAITTI